MREDLEFKKYWIPLRRAVKEDSRMKKSSADPEAVGSDWINRINGNWEKSSCLKGYQGYTGTESQRKKVSYECQEKLQKLKCSYDLNM